MRHPEGPRFLRRLAGRQERGETRAQRRAAELAARHARWLGDPRAGDDRREAERRDLSLTPQQVAARLRELGISDRRGGDRRQGERRRR